MPKNSSTLLPSLSLFLSLAFTCTAPASGVEKAEKKDPAVVAIDEKLKERDYPQALTLLNKYILAHPKSAKAYLLRSDLYRMMGKDSLQLIDLSTAIEVDPKFIPAYIYRSALLKKLNQPERSRADLHKLHELDPKRFKKIEDKQIDNLFKKVDARNAMIEKEMPFLELFHKAREASTSGDYLKSYELYNKLIPLIPQNRHHFETAKDADRFEGMCYYNRSYSFLVTRRYGDALKDLNKCLEKYPDYEDALTNRAKLYELIKRPDLAKKDRDKAAEVKKKPTAPIRMAH